MARIVVIGGSIMGSSLAYHMAMAGHAGDLVVIEPDPTYEWAAAPRSAGGVRRMYGIPENIEMSLYGRSFYQDFARLVDVDGEPGVFPFRELGYLHLVAGSQAVSEVEHNWRIQRANGVANEILDRAALAVRFPFLNVDDIDAGLHGPRDGFIDPHAAVIGFRRKAISLGVEYIQDRVVGLEHDEVAVRRVVLESGRVLDAETVVNLAGAWAPAICRMVGMDVPVAPLSRPTFYFETTETIGPTPLVKDPSGISFRTEGGGFATGLTRQDAAGEFAWEIGAREHAYFEEVMWPALAQRVPAFAALKVQRSWAGHYAMNQFDGNAIIGPWIGGLENFIVAVGFSGAGLQKGPAVGRALTELLLHGEYQSIDLHRLSYQRILDDKPLIEVGFKA
jgi:glycine/D-amino acid oxidase-like deaminating enzyme